ncbi:hypothetical protein MMC27_000671 [Xylographa pallens]|nr:hypothetical protein [Xylographa pallens]
MADDNQNILIRALPPATDYVLYLIVLEYNLRKADLPLLHRLLQDSTLTIKLGWDLIHLLVPLLPASKECLVDVARLGNPREVILKVAELLGKTGRSLWGEEETEEDDSDPDSHSDSDSNEPASNGEKAKVHDASNAAIKKGQHKSSYRSVIEFQALLHMISIVYPRIKTKHPSKFLISAFEAILPAYARVTSSSLSTIAVLTLLEKLYQSAKPVLPPRENSSVNEPIKSEQSAAPDPEGQEETVASEEPGIQIRLLRSFTTHIIEVYFESLPNVDDGPGLAWTQRYLEIRHPERVVPFQKTLLNRFTPLPIRGDLKWSHKLNDLNNRDLMAQKLVVSTRFCRSNIKANLVLQKGALYGVKIPWNDVVWVARHTAEEFLITHRSDSTSKLQSTCTDFPLSRKGMLYILGAELASKVLREQLDRPAMVLGFHFDSVTGFLDPNLAAIGTEPLVVLDTILLLGFTRLEDNLERVSRFSNPEFYQYLQKLSLLSANAPSSSIRYHAHLMATKTLHTYPSKQARFNFIQDTFEHCPYENLLVCTIGWLKDEILAAVASETVVKNEAEIIEEAMENYHLSDDSNASFTFASPETLKSLSLYLFSIDTAGEHHGGYMGRIPFYMTALNLYYLLWVSPVVRDRLQVPAFENLYDIQGSFVKPLRNICEVLLDDPPMAGLRTEHEIAEVQLLQTTVEMVLAAVEKVQPEDSST